MNQQSPAVVNLIRRLVSKRLPAAKKKKSSKKKSSGGVLREYKVKAKKLPTTYKKKLKFGSPEWQAKYKKKAKLARSNKARKAQVKSEGGHGPIKR
jgi:hypothetical protein